ncbi:MAG: hypothetical protein LBP29_00820 [Treponema sp.]|nr:hypothetical protein [Treponema sp.]
MFSALWCPLFSQEYDGEDTAAEKTEEVLPASVFVISEINYAIKGWTKPFAIAYNVELREGVEFQSREDLEAYVARKTQDLRNQRVFKEDSCFIEYSLGNPGEDGKIPVTLDVSVEDSWNIIVLPEPKYDSNSGFSLTLKARDYNFLGTMNPVRLDLGYELDNDGENTYGFLLDSDIPFRAFGLTWTVNFDNELNYTVGDPLYYKNVTGLSVYLPWKTTAFVFGFNQYLYVNEENSDDEKASPGGTTFFKDTWYMASELYGQWRIPTGLEVLSFGSVDYTPAIAETIRYRPGGDVGEWRHPVLSLSHSVGFGRIDWLGNYRQGLNVRLTNGNYLDQVDNTWSNYFAAAAIAHYRFGKLLGVSGRLLFQAWREDPHTGAGDILRGIYNDDLTARKMLSLNLEFPFRLIRFVPSEWFRHKNWRILDFEQHWSPFIDMAIADDPNKEYDKDGIRFAPSDIITTVGLEVITFPLSWRSIYLRISVGCDLKGDIREWPKKHNKVFLPSGSEIYIGLGHFF